MNEIMEYGIIYERRNEEETSVCVILLIFILLYRLFKNSKINKKLKNELNI